MGARRAWFRIRLGAGLLACGTGVAWAAGPDVLQVLDAYAPRQAQVAQALWRQPELGYLEERSSRLLQQELREAGFRIETGVAGMPTAFVASSGTRGSGPVIALLAEMDALPGMAQAAEPVRLPIDGQDAGQACGHNLFGAASVGAARAVAQWLQATGTPGEVRLYGTPAEEGGSGKVYLARAGLFDDVDVVLHWHPAAENSAAQGTSLANISGKFRFHGLAAHAAIAPERGRSALDAVEAFNHMANLMREHVPDGTRIHYVISNGGSAPNVVPDFAEAYYYVRHVDPAVVREVFARLRRAADGAALGTGTTVEFEQTGGVFSLLPNDTLGQVMQVALEQAVEEVAGLSGWELKRIMRTGTVATIDNRNWELREHLEPVQRFSQSRAIALDMESATIAANGFRFRVPYGTLLCVSDKPLHGELKLPGMASAFYRRQVGQHLDIGLLALEILSKMPPERLHSRKLRSFLETAFQ